MKASSASSAQCRSSITSTSGRRAASDCRKRRQAANASSWRAGWIDRSSAAPSSRRRWALTQAAPLWSPPSAYSVAWAILRSIRSGLSVSRMPASALMISPSAPKVTPSP